jgi:hypothetical protein
VEDQLAASQEELISKVSAIKACQSESDETVTDMRDRYLKGIMAVVNLQVQNFHEEFSSEL